MVQLLFIYIFLHQQQHKLNSCIVQPRSAPEHLFY